MEQSKIVVIRMAADDALLLQAHLREDRHRFEVAQNEVMTGMLDRVEMALQNRKYPRCRWRWNPGVLSTAQKPTWCKLPLRHEGPCDFGDTGGKVENFEGDDEEA